MKYFKLKEFACPCCKKADMDLEFLDMIDEARGLAKKPFKINSGYRCKEWNLKVGGRVGSSHVKGYAADIHCADSRSRALIIDAVAHAGFNRIGIAKNFIHIDNDPKKDKVVIWLYQ